MTKSVVIDASLAFRLVVPGTQQAHFRALVAQWDESGYALCAPALWLYEITSALCKTIHFGELTPEEGQHALSLSQRLGVQLFAPDEAQAHLAVAWTLRLKRAAAYDSFYLALAETLRAELWTADKRLHATADRPWVRWAGPS
ncbi:MAG: type II toxin-antitoxin system VapC family toxin [Anaerolineae bacterium]|nr:type II toxin-antitoxin system VapC family toxin [Anaerolineae bacterium]